jgi:hypothetical protein
MHSLFYYHLIATAIHVTSFIFLINIAQEEEGYQLKIPYVTYENGVATHLSADVFGKISIVTVLIVNEAITAISHLVGVLGFAFFRNRMVEDTRHLEIIRRYVEYAITAALLEVVLYLLLGGQDVNLLLAIVLTNIVIQILGYMLERSQNVQRQVYLNVSGFVLLLVPIVSFLSVSFQSNDFTGIAIYYSILYALFGVHSLMNVVSVAWRSFVDKDIGFIVLGSVTKEVLAWMAVALQFKLLGDKSGFKDLGGVDVDALIVWLPLGGLLFAMLAIIGSSRVDVQDSYTAL